MRRSLPVPAWLQGRGGRPEGYCHRQMLDAVRYVVDNGVEWANLPADFPPFRRVHAFARRWQVTGLLAELRDRLRDRVRVKEGRDVDPSAAIVDSQSVRAAANIPRATSGWDGGKNVPGRKRRVVVDCLGLRLAVLVTAASGSLLISPRLTNDHRRNEGASPTPNSGKPPTNKLHERVASNRTLLTGYLSAGSLLVNGTPHWIRAVVRPRKVRVHWTRPEPVVLRSLADRAGSSGLISGGTLTAHDTQTAGNRPVEAKIGQLLLVRLAPAGPRVGSERSTRQRADAYALTQGATG
ncbi:transposase [Streptomyces sp. NPDC050315]|uniref:transposase n=1 Tax=Streptomyces sp. NPDC050315 TaxID=3155039 RepID=UPI0034460FC0